MKMKLLLTALTSLIGTAVFAADAPPVGSAAPDFSVPDANGKTHSLSQYKGKYVVLEWFNPQCPFVKKHYGSSNMMVRGGAMRTSLPFTLTWSRSPGCALKSVQVSPLIVTLPVAINSSQCRRDPTPAAARKRFKRTKRA